MIKLNNLSTDLKHVTVEYLDIVNYEIARENICGYIFLLSRLSKDAEPTEKMQMESKIQNLIYYRDNLQIEDKDNIQKVLNTLIQSIKPNKKTKQLRKIRLQYRANQKAVDLYFLLNIR